MDFTHINIELESGTVKIKLRTDLAPNHCERVAELANEGFYDGVVFHRVIPNFMAQTGDPTGTGTGGSNKPDLKQEFSPENHLRGTASMARSQNPDSANSQFFLMFEEAAHLNGKYTIVGQVISGIEVMMNIKK